MTQEEKLKKIIKRAIKRGYDFSYTMNVFEKEENLWEIVYGKWRWMDSIIFSHSFAKAYFGEGLEYEVYHGVVLELPAWKYQLKKLVIADDRIEYLYKFVED